jgi:RNA recognition motif-containing protein
MVVNMIPQQLDRQTSYSAIVTQNLQNLMMDEDDLQALPSNKQVSKINLGNRTRKHRDKVRDKTDRKTVYVADLQTYHTDKDIVNLFRPIGALNKVSKPKDATYAYVTFEKAESAKEALNIAVFKIDIHPIRVMPYNQPEVFDPNANLIIKNLESYVDEPAIIKKFEVFGEILSCKVVRDSDGNSKCFAYLQFKTPDSANEAIDVLNNTYWDETTDPDKQYKIYKERMAALNNENTLDLNAFIAQFPKGKKIFVGLFKKRDEYTKAKTSKEGKLSNLYVKNLGPDFGDRNLYNLFKQFGIIKSAKIRRMKENNKPLGCGFVDFEEPEDAEHARLALDGYVLREFDNRVITVKYADCKSRRQRNLEKFNTFDNNDSHDINMTSPAHSITSSSTSYLFDDLNSDSLSDIYASIHSNESTNYLTNFLNSKQNQSNSYVDICQFWNTKLHTDSWNEYKLF